MQLRTIRTEELPTEFIVTKHAYGQAHVRHKRRMKNRDVDKYLNEVAQHGEFFLLPSISKGGVSYAKTDGKVVVFIRVDAEESGALESVGYVTTVGEVDR